MSPIRPEDLPENHHHADLRAYERRLVDWLGLRAEELLDISETETGGTTPTDSPGLRVRWGAIAAQTPTRGTAEGPGKIVAGDEAAGRVRYFGSVHLDFEEVRELRADVGERPVHPGAPT